MAVHPHVAMANHFNLDLDDQYEPVKVGYSGFLMVASDHIVAAESEFTFVAIRR